MTPTHIQKMAADGIMMASRPDKMTRYLGIRPTRTLSRAEEEEITNEEGKLVPRIFTAGGDPIAADMSSPVATGAAAAAVTALPIAAAAVLLQKLMPNSTAGQNTAISALPLAALAGAYGYFTRRAANRDIKDYIGRMPPGSTRRDLENNPEWQAENDTEKLLNTAKMNAAARGTFKTQSFASPRNGAAILENLDEQD
jgi:hypothetical protein